MDSDARAIVLVLLAGGAITAIGIVTLFYFFRALGTEKRGSRRSVAIVTALITFIFACCAVLFWMARAEI